MKDEGRKTENRRQETGDIRYKTKDRNKE